MDNATLVFLAAFADFVIIFILLGLKERSRQEKKLKKEIHESYGRFNTAGISAERMQIRHTKKPVFFILTMTRPRTMGPTIIIME